MFTVIVTAICIYFAVKCRWMRRERQTRRMFELVDKILGKKFAMSFTRMLARGVCNCGTLKARSHDPICRIRFLSDSRIRLSEKSDGNSQIELALFFSDEIKGSRLAKLHRFEKD